MKIIKAVYVGSENEAYKINKEYQLRVEHHRSFLGFCWIHVETTSGLGRRNYDDLEHFLESWTAIKVEK